VGLPSIPHNLGLEVTDGSTASKPTGMDIESTWKAKMNKRKVASSFVRVDQPIGDVSP
jgi:hypothetical protein